MRFCPALVCFLLTGGAVVARELVVQERLGRTWRNEVVTLAVGDAELMAARDGRALLDAASRAYPSQLLPGKRLGVLLDLAPGQRLDLHFGEEAASSPATDLKVESDGDELRLTNGQTGIAVRRRLSGRQGPIRAVRTTDGTWIGGSTLAFETTGVEYGATVTLDGPVLAEVQCGLKLPDGGRWSYTIRLQAGEPVAVVTEDFADVSGADLDVDIGSGWAPDTILYRYGKSEAGRRVGYVAETPLSDIAGNPKFVLEPWLHWWERTTQGNWVGLYRAGGGPMVLVAAHRPSLWVDPGQTRVNRRFAKTPLVAEEDGVLRLQFRGANAARAWMIGAMDSAPVLESLAEEKARYNAPPPQDALVKHGHFPLDSVHQQVLHWPETDRPHPRLFIDRDALAAFRERYQPNPGELTRILRQPVRMYEFDNIFYHFLGSGDAELEQKLVESAIAMTAQMAARIHEQNDLVYYGFAPHHQNAIRACAAVVDLIWDSQLLEAAERERIRARLAFIAYAVSGPDYWSPARGFSANPNMTTFAASYAAVLGALLRDHPESDGWLDAGMGELERQIREWSGPNGGWLEAPHYCMASYDPLVAYFLMAHLAGRSDLLFAERTKRVALWFAKIATPPDSRLKGWRHNPPIGNTYKLEPCGQYGLLAALWRDHDPDLAAHMQWMHEQQGSAKTPGVGGFFAALAGYRRIYTDIRVDARQPAWGSELFPNAGAVLRAHFPSDRETMLYLIAGPFHDHYDKDSGSITLWGKGRIIADDFGYQGYMPAADHSMLDAAGVPEAARMAPEAFETTPHLDYVSGTKHAWRRQIALLKDDDPLGPNLVVLHDTLAAPAAGTWRLWLTAADVRCAGNTVAVTGHEDVDTAILFTRVPGDAGITTADLTRETWGLNGEARYGRTSSTQTAVVVSWQAGDAVTAVIYPRLRDEKPPVMTPLASGAGVRIEGPHGTDYVFLNHTPVEIEADDVRFRGTVGAVRLRPEKPPQLSLAASGSLACRDQRLERP